MKITFFFPMITLKKNFFFLMITFKFQVSFSPTLCSHLTDELSAEMRRAPTGPAPRGSAPCSKPGLSAEASGHQASPAPLATGDSRR